MNHMPQQTEFNVPVASAHQKPAREWMPILARYREPSLPRSLTEFSLTAVPLALLWLAAWWSLSVSYWLTLAICLPTAGFLVRLFTIQHDCGHGSYFRNKTLNDWVGRSIGVFTLTPYYVWRRAHSRHHGSSGNLDDRGIGAVHTLTVKEYRAKPLFGRLTYRLFRHPVILFGLGPAYVFFLQNRLPIEFMRGGWSYWISAMGTNFGILLFVSAMIYLMGAAPFFMIWLPMMLMAASIGVWLFYVQHQFADTHWARGDDWQLHDAALYGSSHYDLPRPLRWITGNIGIHHVHHLNSRIPSYRLPQILKDHPALGNIRRLTLWRSLASINLHLWCETRQRLVSFSDAKRLALPV